MAYIKIFITNLGKYNEGELVGKWIDLPCYDFEEQLEDIGGSNEPDENGQYYEEWFVTDYETDIDGLEISEHPDIDELNDIAETIEGWDDNDEILAFGACLDFGFDISQAISIVEDRDYMIFADCYNMTDVAKEYVSQIGDLENAVGWDKARDYIDWESYIQDLSYDMDEDSARAYAEEVEYSGDYDEEFIESYFDWEAYGRDMEIEGNFVDMGNGVFVEILRD